MFCPVRSRNKYMSQPNTGHMRLQISVFIPESCWHQSWAVGKGT